jgi:hypothetical protein
MSEPTGGDNQEPDQDQTSGSVFNDPTAPIWADPTAQFPRPRADDAPAAPVQDAPPAPPDRRSPPAPPGVASPYGQQPDAPQGSPPAAPPMSNPYAQQPPVQRPPAQQYGQQAPAYGQQPPAQQYGQPAPAYGQPAPAYGQPAPAYGQQAYGTGAPAETNVSAVILTIVSGVSMLLTCFSIGIPSLIFGIMALTANKTDPADSGKKAKTGWIVFAVNVVVVVVVVVIGFILLALNSEPTRSRGSI